MPTGMCFTRLPARRALGFAGGYRYCADVTGLDYLKTRYYSESEGRFISRDQSVTKEDRTCNVHAYDNPVNRVDPSGLQPPIPPGPGSPYYDPNPYREIDITPIFAIRNPGESYNCCVQRCSGGLGEAWTGGIFGGIGVAFRADCRADIGAPFVGSVPQLGAVIGVGSGGLAVGTLINCALSCIGTSGNGHYHYSFY